MIPEADRFRSWYVEAGGSPASANSYLTYLCRVDALCGGIERWLLSKSLNRLADWTEALPTQAFGAVVNRRNSLAAVHKYIEFCTRSIPVACAVEPQVVEVHAAPAKDEFSELLDAVKALGARYYRITGKPLGVTGEIAELAAARLLGLRLCAAREPGFDAWDDALTPSSRIQIKGRAVNAADRYRGRCPSIKRGDMFDEVILVLLDLQSLEPLEIWRAGEAAVIERLSKPGSKSRNERGSMGLTQFRSIAQRVWITPG